MEIHDVKFSSCMLDLDLSSRMQRVGQIMCVSVSDEASHMGTWEYGYEIWKWNNIILHASMLIQSQPLGTLELCCPKTTEFGQVLASAWDRNERGSKVPDSTCWKSGKARGNTLDDSRRLAGIHRTIPEGSGANKSSLEASRLSLSCVFSSFEKDSFWIAVLPSSLF